MEIKFISYTGSFPNLCSGVLTLEINDKIYKFGRTFEECNESNYKTFWFSGGCVDLLECDSVEAPWEINKNKLPKELREYSEEIIKIFNENVPFGCCGGCI